MPAPTIGRIVHYTLTEDDAATINKRRDDFWRHRNLHENYQDTGYMAHYGDDADAGEVLPLIITRVMGNAVAGHVLLNGTDTLWVQMVSNGPDRGQWEWPVIIPESR